MFLFRNPSNMHFVPRSWTKPLYDFYIWFVQAPIYVSKEIVFTDAIRLGYGMGRVHNKKAIYDVLLDRYCIVIVSYRVTCSILATIDSVCKFPPLHSCYIIWARTSFVCYSAIDGPDSVAQELSMMHNMHLAIKQERFNDAGKISFGYDCIHIFYTSASIMVTICCLLQAWIPKSWHFHGIT